MPLRTTPARFSGALRRTIARTRSAPVVFGLLVLAALLSTASAAINSPTNAIGTVGLPFGYQISSTDTNSGKVYSASNLPPGILLSNTNTGLITGLPQVATNQTASVTVRSSGATNTTNVVITVNPPAAPVFAGPLTYFGMQGEPLRYALLSEPNHSNVPTTFSVSNLPAGATLISNVTTNAAYTNVVVTNYFINAASISTNGSFVVPVITRNQGGTNSNNVTLVVAPATAPVITSTNVASGVVGVPFNFDVTAINSPLRFRVTSIQVGSGVPTIGLNITNGPLANGLSFSNVSSGGYVFGRIFGSPSVATNVILGLEAINNTLAVGAQTLTINVAPSQPTVILTQPLGEANYVLGSSFFLNAQAFDRLPDAIDPSSVGFTAGGVPVSGTVARRGEFYGVEFYPTNGAAFPVVATARNKSGQAVTSSPLPMTPQTPQAAFPTIEMLPLFPGPQVQAGGEVTLRARASSPQTAIQRVEFYVNKVFVDAVTAPAAGTANEYQLRWQTPTTPQNFEVHARVVSINIPAGALGLGTPPFYASTITRSPVTLSTVPGVLPSVAIVTPSDGAQLPFNVATRVTASANVFGGSIQQVQFYVDGRPLGAADTAAPYAVDFTPTSYGTYQLFAIATSSAGLINISPTVTVSVPEVQGGKPTVERIKVNNVDSATHAAQTGQVINLTTEAGDRDGNVVNVEFLANGVALPSPDLFGSLNPDAGAPYRYVFAPSAPGRYELIARATDNAGNITDSDPTVLFVSVGSPPTIKITAPKESPVPPAAIPVYDMRINEDVTIRALAEVAQLGANVQQVEFLFNGRRPNPGSVTPTPPPGVPPGVLGPLPFGSGLPYDLIWRADNTGRYLVVARVTDNLGNVRDSEPIEINVTQGDAPTVSITSPTATDKLTPGVPATIVATPVGGSGSVTQVEFFVNGASLGLSAPPNAPPYAASFTPSAVGPYTLMARVTDSLGNVADSAKLVVNAEAPTTAQPLVSLSGVPSVTNLATGSEVYLNATATKADGTADPSIKVVFLVNGIPIAGSPDVALKPSSYSAKFTVGNNALYTIQAVATDGAGVKAASNQATITARARQNDLPQVQMLDLLPGASPVAGGTVTLRAQALFPVSAAANSRVQFYGNGVLLGETAAPVGNIYSFVWTVPQGLTGDVKISARAVADNFATVIVPGTTTTFVGSVISSNITTIVNLNPGPVPTVSITAPTGTIPVNIPVIINVDASVTGGTVASVEFYVNGVLQPSAAPNNLNPDVAFPFAYEWTPSSPGIYKLGVIATSDAGIAKADEATVTVTSGAPPAVNFDIGGGSGDLAVASPALAAARSGNTVVFTFVARDGVTYTIQETSNLSTGTWAASSVVPSDSGNQAGVALGYTRKQFSVPIGPAPRFFRVLHAATSGNQFNVNQTAFLQAKASDSDGNIRQVEFLINGLPQPPPLVRGPFRFDLQLLTPGRYEIVARATDNLGNVTDSAPQIVNVTSGKVPTVAITTPTNDFLTPTDQLTVAWTASDPDGSVQIAQLLVNGAQANSPVGVPIIFDANVNPAASPGSNRAAFLPPSQGIYDFVVRVTDNLGNVTDSAPVRVTVDNSAPRKLPTVNLVQPAGITVAVVGSEFYLNASVVPAAGASIPDDGVRFYRQGQLLTGPVTRLGDIFSGVSRLDIVSQFPYAPFDPSRLGNEFFAEASDSAGLIGSSEIIRIGSYAPRSPLPVIEMLPLYGGGGTTGAGGIVRLQARATFPTPPSPASANPLVEFFANGIWIGLGQVDSNGVYFFDWRTPVSPDAYLITARAQSVNWQAGTIFDSLPPDIPVYASTITDNFTAVNTLTSAPPTVTLTAPSNGTALAVGVASIVKAQAEIPVGGFGTIERVEFYANGRLIEVAAGSTLGTNPDLSAPYQIEFAPQSPGPYTLVAVAYSTSGTVQSSAEVKVSAVLGLAPTSFLTTSTSARASATVASGQVSALVLSNGGSGYSTNLDPGVRLVGGTTNTTATAKAVVGTGGSVTNFTSLVGGSGYTNAPTVVIDPPPVVAATNATVLLQATATDDGSIRQVDFLRNGVIVGTASNSPYNFNLPVTAIGSYQLVARAIDNLGNVTDSPYITLLARGGSSPAVSITDPLNNTTVTPGVPVTVTANASDSDGSVVRVELLVNGVVVGTDTQAPFIFADAGQFSTDTNTTFTPTSQGQYVIVARAVDNVGNVTDSTPVTVTATAPPVGAPTVQMTQPLGEIYYVDGSSYFLNARITDAPPGTINTNSVKFSVNGVPVTGSTLGIIGNDYGVRYRPINLFGIDAARAEALDNEGNRGFSQPNYTVLSIPQYPLPTVEMLPLLPNTPTNAGGTVRLRAEALFPSTASAEARVEFYANNVFVGTASNDPTDAAVFLYDWSTPTNQASYVVQARAVARNFQTAVGEGNVVRFFGSIISDNATAVNTIPGVAPTVSITQPTNGQNVNVNQPLNIRANAATAGGTIGRVEFFANGQLVDVDTNAVYEANFTPPSTGIYNLSAIAYTETGILKVSDTVTVNSVLGTPPAVTIQAPAKAAVGRTALLSATPTPFGDGRSIKRVEFLVNNVIVATNGSYPYQYEWPVQAPGNYQIQARAIDNVDNVGLSPITNLVTFYEPLVTLTALPTTVRQGEVVQLRSRASTDEIGVTISNVLFANEADVALPSPGANGGPNPDTTTNSSGFYDYFYTASQPGVIRLKAIATDTAGNKGESAVVPITVEADASVPIINITSPAANSRVELNAPLLITAGATPGANATITSVQFRVVDPDGILTTLTATQTASPYSVSYTGVTKPGFYNITAQVFNSVGKSNVSNVVVEAVSVVPPVPGTNSAFVYDMFRLLFYRAATPLETDYWTEWLNEQTPGGDLAPLSVRAQMVMSLMGFNAGGGVFTQSSGPATSAVASYQATSGTALQPYGRLGIKPTRALVLDFLADVLSDVSENPPSGKPLPIEGSYSGIPGAPYGATYGMAGGMQTVFNSTPFQSAYPGITSLDNNAFTLWLMNTMFQGRALGDGLAVRNMMNTIVPQSDRQGSGAAFFTRLEGTILANYSYFDPSGTALEKAFQLQVNSAALRFQLQGSGQQFWNYTTAPAYSQSVVETYLQLYWDDVQ